VTKEAVERRQELRRYRIKGRVDARGFDGRSFQMQGYEKGFYMGGCLFDNVTKNMRIYKKRIFGPVLSVVRAKDYSERARVAVGFMTMGNGVCDLYRDGDAARRFAAKVNVGMVV